MFRRLATRAAPACVLCLTLALAGGCREEGGVEVSSLKITGAEAVEAGQLKAILATKESSWIPWGEKHYFSREQFEADLKRIQAFYRDRGFPDAQVSSFDVELSPDQSSVDITLNISEGEPIVVERIELRGFDVLPPRPRQNLEQALLPPGAPLDRAAVRTAREDALDRLKEWGYPYATVTVADSPGTSPRSRVLALTAEPGPLARFGDIEIQGNTSVSETVIRRQLTFAPGQRYRQSRLIESQRNLYSLDVFEFANVQPIREEGEKPIEIPTRITVTEGDHRKVNLAVGYGTEEKGRIEGDWRHVNFFGGARTAGVLARYSGLDRGVKLDFTQPWLVSPRYSVSLQSQYWHNDEPGFFTLDNVGGRATITRTFGMGGPRIPGSSRSTSLSLTYANEWEDFTIANEALSDLSLRDELIAMGLDPRTGVGTGRRSSLSIDAARITAINVVDATGGYVASLHLEQGGTWLGGDYNYREVTGEGRYYHRVSDWGVIAVRARGGSIDPSDGDLSNVPFYKRYFLGGATNLRGWGRFDVGPLSGAGLPIGGHTFFHFSTELRAPIWGNLSGALFLDGGNVWSDPWDFNFRDMRYDVGPGLRYKTPIGPIRVDLGFQLNPIDGLLVNGEPEPRHFRVHFSIGQAF